MSVKTKKSSQLATNAKRFGRAAEATINKIEKAEKEFAAIRVKVERHFSDSFAWAFLYELPYVQLLILLMAALGILDEFVQSVNSAVNPQEMVLDQIEREMDDDTPLEWKGGADGKFSEEDVFAILTAVFRSLKSLGLYGSYMPELVEQVRNGSETAFFHALRVDRTVITCPSVALFAMTRLSRAEFFQDKRYLAQFIGAMKGKPPKSLRTHRKLRVTLQFLLEAGLLRKNQEVTKDDIAFIQEVGVYSKQAGAERGLEQFVRRWLDSKVSPTQKE
jgi:hypothetical protein